MVVGEESVWPGVATTYSGAWWALKVVSHCHSFQHSEWQIEGQTHGWRANRRAKWGSHWHSPLQFFSALCPPYTLHQSLLWSHTGRLYAALKMSPDEKSAERNTSHHYVWMSTEWQRVFFHFLQSTLLVWQVSTQSQRALALCPWMWASKWVTVWHHHNVGLESPELMEPEESYPTL